MPNNTTGPKPGDGRIRNTAANALSKLSDPFAGQGAKQGAGGPGMAALPALSPGATASYYNQLGGLYSQYQTTLAGLRSQRMGIRANALQQRAGVRSEMISGLATAENAGIERGISGSSAELQGRADVRGAAAAGIAQIEADKLNQLGQLQNQKAQAAVGLYQGVTGLQAGVVAQQDEALAQQLQNNLIVSGQESQMDALKAMFDAQMAALQPPGGNGGKKKPSGYNGTAGGFTSLPMGQQADYYGMNVPDYISTIRGGKR